MFEAGRADGDALGLGSAVHGDEHVAQRVHDSGGGLGHGGVRGDLRGCGGGEGRVSSTPPSCFRTRELIVQP